MSSLALDEEWHFSKPFFHGFFIFLYTTITCIHGAVMGSRQIHVGGTYWVTNKLLQFIAVTVHVMTGSEETESTCPAACWGALGSAGVHYLQVQVFIPHGAAWLKPCTRVLHLLRKYIRKKTSSETTKPLYFYPNFFFLLLTCSCLPWSHALPLGFSKLWVVLNNVSVIKYAAST